MSISCLVFSSVLDSAVLQDESGEGKIIWVFLPYYEVRLTFHPETHPRRLGPSDLRPIFSFLQRGNLQDLITRSSLSTPPTYPPEAQLLQLFIGTCKAVRAMHQYRPNSKPSSTSSGAGSSGAAYPPAGGAGVGGGDFQAPEGEEEGGLLLATRGGAGSGAIFVEAEESGGAKQSVGAVPEEAGPDGLYPYAHRDIKRESGAISALRRLVSG